MAASRPATFGLVSKPVKKYRVEIRYVNHKNGDVKDNKFINVQVTDLTALRKDLLRQYGHTPTINAIIEDENGRVGELDMAYPGCPPVWYSAKSNRSYSGVQVTPNGGLATNVKYHPYYDYEKYSAIGIPIYKIWRNMFGNFDVLGRKFNGEWVFGHDYDLKDGVWKGGKYDYDIDNLYKRVGRNFPKPYIDNKRGPTGKF